MKNILLGFTLSIACLGSFTNALSNEDEGEIEKDIVLYFSNGMFNDEDGAINALGELYILVKDIYINDKKTWDRIIFDYSYNNNEEKLEQFLEVFEQKTISNIHEFFSWLSGGSQPDGWVEFLTQVQMNKDKDISKHVSSYTEDIENDYCVVVVAHSQGNFYANFSYDIVEPSFNRKKQMQVIGVGTPDYRVAGDGKYATLEEDWIIDNILGNISTNTLEANVTNGWMPFANPEDYTGHQFLASYLQGINSGPKIRDFIKDSINTAAKTCGFKITAFDNEAHAIEYYSNSGFKNNLEIYWTGNNIKLPIKSKLKLKECAENVYCANNDSDPNISTSTLSPLSLPPMNNKMKPYLRPYSCGTLNFPFTYVGIYDSIFEVILEDSEGRVTPPKDVTLTCNVYQGGIVFGSWHPTQVMIY